MPPEARLVRRIQQVIKRRGGRSFKIHGGDNPFQEVGIPDLLVCYKGYFVAIEVKTPAGKLSTRQEFVLETIRQAGGIVLVTRSVEKVEATLDKLDRRS